MPYTDQTEYPRGIFSKSDLTNAAVDIGTAGVAQKVSHFILRGGAAGTDTVIFRDSVGTNEYFRVPLDTNELLHFSRGFEAEAGLEILTAAVAGDVYAVIFYVTD